MNKNILTGLAITAFALTAAKVFSGSQIFTISAFILLLILAGLGIREAYTNVQLRKTFLIISLFGIWGLITALWSEYSLISLQKSFYLLAITIGSAAAGWFYAEGRTANFILWVNLALTSILLFSLFFSYPNGAWSGGSGAGFRGAALHQNTIAGLLLFTLPGGVIELLNKFKERRKTAVYYLTGLLLVNIVLITLSYSRAAILALGIFFFIAAFNLLSKKKHKLLLTAAVIITAAIVFNISFMQAVLLKNEGELGDNRWFMFQDSFKAAGLGGVAGLGYGISHPEIINKANGSRFVEGRFIREKGNSVLAVIEETGYVGFILFLLPLGYIFWGVTGGRVRGGRGKAMKTKDDFKNLKLIIVFSFIIAAIVHAQFEAWWVGPGSVVYPFFIVYVGMATPMLKKMD
jgi:hypothetical protein